MDYELPDGFLWSGVSAGIKYEGRLDLALVVAETTATAAGVFTRNSFAAPPVLYCRNTLLTAGSAIHGIVVNAGCANAATGTLGTANTARMAKSAAAASGRPPGTPFLVCSTGTIGVQLPMDRIDAGVAAAAASLTPTHEGFLNFSRAIMTTDTRQKIAWRKTRVGGRTVRIVGCAKGSGMIDPRMATLLAFVATDAAVDPDTLDALFRHAVQRSLNCVTVDGDTSTNDSAIILASGASAATLAPGASGFDDFQQALLEVLQSLARQIARDGEGATKLIQVRVTGASTFEHARDLARQVANSNLVKTAIYGRDANWGRICCALGYAPSPPDPDHVTVRLGNLTLFADGAPLPLDEEAALAVLSAEFVPIEASVGNGPGDATVWTCDLTERYIEINGSYRT